uniref:VWFA domain-containing protein n=1 Tax=Tetradesmus obliquus TaxID=3088 RepID=A0A383V3G9_TETOB|eukprot:jgi/Sobl393_1/350/SZX60138.1
MQACGRLPSLERFPSKLARLASEDAVSDFACLPDELLLLVVKRLGGVQELLSFAACAQRFHGAVVNNEPIWESLFSKRFGKPTKLHLSAHNLAGSWLTLYRAKVITAKAAEPWRKPTTFELQAALQDLAHGGSSGSYSISSSCSSSDVVPGSPSCSLSDNSQSSSSTEVPLEPGQEAAAAAAAEVDTLAVVFLVDGSGSVGEEDFTCMTEFLETAGQAVAAVPHSKVSIVQFSNDTRVEVPLGPWQKDSFEAGIRNMVRMNGGTNIAAAVAKAGSLFKSCASCTPSTRRVLVLLTDGRIDSYQAREAGQMVGQLADEQANVGLWAFGVGRGVDVGELVRIIEGAGGAAKGLGAERYVELCVRDDAPW